MSGSSWRNADVFESLCGKGALQNVMLVTTMWSNVNEEIGSAREDELKTLYWNSMIDSGSRMMRFDHTSQGAWHILDQLTGNPQATALQVQIVDERKRLGETDAGIKHFGWLERLIAQFRRIIEVLEQLLQGSSKRSNPIFVKDLQHKKSETKGKIRRVNEMQRQLLTAKRPTLPVAKLPRPLSIARSQSLSQISQSVRTSEAFLFPSDDALDLSRTSIASELEGAFMENIWHDRPAPFFKSLLDLMSMIMDSSNVC